MPKVRTQSPPHLKRLKKKGGTAAANSVCPRCGGAMLVKRPSRSGRAVSQCPACGKSFGAMALSP